MQPGRYNFQAQQGATFARGIVYKQNDVVVNLTGYSARMQVRASVSDSSTLISLSSPSSGITIDGPNGEITVTISAATMASVPAGTWVYDLEIESGGGVVTRLIEGKFSVSAEVTR